MSLIGFDALLWLYSQFYVHDGSKFCRQDGMVTIGRRFKKPFTAPFYEFDPVMQLQVTPHGGHDYVLWLHHRYSSTKVCLANKLHGLGLDKQNLYAFWDTLQRYMDVEQPLPDLPVLEQSRHLDPVTVEYDRQHNRPERYWRNTTLEQWQQSTDAKALRENVEHYPWQQQPCTLQPHLDPQLDVESYYRSQQAKGIFATPRPEDYDNIHRPALKIFQDKKPDDV